MVRFGRFIARHRVLILIFYVLLLIPSVFGYAKTRINYDVLSYLPNSLETVKGQDIMVDQFGMGAFSMVVVEDMEQKDILALKQQLSQVEHISDILWYDDALDISVPTEMLPQKLHDALFNGDATMMVVLFDNTTSSDETMSAVSDMRQIVSEKCFISGMSGVVTDIKELFLQEMPIYVVIAALLSLVVLCIAMDSFFVPVLFLVSIGAAILYNLGSNIIIGEISYITEALTAVLQLGVTMDYSIFLLNSYMENEKKYPDDKESAMANAISETFKAVAGSSVTTVAGFAALMLMTFSLGKNIGIVMMKGVILGVICCITLLPAMILCFEKIIKKTTHRPVIKSLDGMSGFITKHSGAFLLVFAALLVPSLFGNSNNTLYYNIDSSLPKTLASSVANKKLEEDFDMNSVYMMMVKNDVTATQKKELLSQVENVDGVKWAIGINSFVGTAVPDSMIPDSLKSALKSDDYEIQIISSDYKTATDEANKQIEQVNSILKSYSKDSLVIGEAPLTKDLADVTDVDLARVNIASIAAIFIIIMFTFKSISLPVILVAVIEFAICVNMSVPYYTDTPLPFVASIVIGTIQLGATVDYAILMTGKYQNERMAGKNKYEAVRCAHAGSIKPILISGCSFFAATFGVGIYSKIDMISSITVLLSRGAVISTIVVLTILPAMFLVFDRVICATTSGMKQKVTNKAVGQYSEER
ncbi:MAG: efflux RND transporter permease subunit [Oscillospiraceae bacterium]|nr:efflux RND transporter permease subunit [Oscillospiraceae bacterium]